MSTLNVDFAASVFFDDLCCVTDSFQLSKFNCSRFVLCQEVSLGCPWSYRTFFLGESCSSLCFSLPNLSDPSLMLMILARNSARTV